MESKRFIPSGAKRATSDIGKLYDWKYAECKWEIDPWDRRIDGEVLHIVELLNETDSIDFDFNDDLQIESVMVDDVMVSDFGVSAANALYIRSTLLEKGMNHEI